MRRAYAIAAALIAVSAPPALAQLAPVAPGAPPPAPIVRAGVTEKVSPHVSIIPDAGVPAVPNAGFVIGSKASLVVDTGMGERNARTILAEFAKLRPGAPTYLVTTHVHPEHDLGATAFPAETRLIRSQDQVDEIRDDGMRMADLFRKRGPAFVELLDGARFRPADIVFEKEHVLDLGGVTVRIVAMGPNHTPGDTVVLVEPDGVMFSGDVAMKFQPSFASPASSIAHWLASLDRIEAMKPKLLVPSHGPVGGPEIVDGYRKYLTAIRDQVAADRAAGRGEAEAVAAVVSRMSGEWPDKGRLEGAAKAAWAEAGR